MADYNFDAVKRMNFYEDRQYTDNELIERVWDKEILQNIMGRRAFYYANNERRRELDELWVQKRENRRTASFARNNGYYVGMDAIKKFYVSEHTDRQYEALRAMAANDSSIEVSSRSLGQGWCGFEMVTTPMIYIAGDGRTARGLWCCPGLDTETLASGKAEAFWLNSMMGVDFIKEDGEWKIWHLVIAKDYFAEVGADFRTGPVDIEPSEDKFEATFGTPTIPMTVHNPRYLWSDDYPAMPLPYETFNDANSYGPEGHFNYKEAK